MEDSAKWTGQQRALAHERIDRLKDYIGRFCKEPEANMRDTPTPHLMCTLGALLYLVKHIETELTARGDWES